MSEKKLKLLIATPERKFFEDEVDMIIARTVEGEMGILPGHLPIISVLDVGMIHIKCNNEEKIATLNMGFMQLVDNELSIFTDSAEWPDEIDVERAQKAKERAEERLRQKAEIDVQRAELALKRAINRINAKN